MINIKDRVPDVGKANRKLITPESGDPFYAKVEYADDPIFAGTPLNRVTLLALQGFSANETVFNSDGSITETNGDNDTKVTVFNSDGSITETFTSNGISIAKETTFNADGSISEVMI